MKGQEEIYLPTSVNREELNSQAQVKEPTLPIAICVSPHFIATWKRTQSSIHWNTVLYFKFFFFSFKCIKHSNQLNPKSGWLATAKRLMIRTSRFLKSLQMMMGKSLKSFYGRRHHITNNRAESRVFPMCICTHGEGNCNSVISFPPQD